MALGPTDDPPPVDAYGDARRAWPAVSVDRPTFERYVEERVPPAERGSFRAADLYLACACSRGDGRALAEFEKRYLEEVASFVAGRERPHGIDEVLQLLRERLFVERKIAQYTGRGPLASWLRVVTLRLTSNMRREERRHATLDEAIPGAALDPELGVIRKRYAGHFEEAARLAIASLGADERTLLRLYYLDHLNIDRIAVVFGVSRATIGRRMIDVRERVVETVHRLLRKELGASAEEVASLLRVVRSDLAMSLSVVLGGR